MRHNLFTLLLIVLIGTVSIVIGSNSSKNYITASELTAVLKQGGYNVKVNKDGSYEMAKKPVDVTQQEVLDALVGADVQVGSLTVTNDVSTGKDGLLIDNQALFHEYNVAEHSIPLFTGDMENWQQDEMIRDMFHALKDAGVVVQAE